LTRVYVHTGYKEYCKDFIVAFDMFDVFEKKQLYNSVITGKEKASKTVILKMGSAVLLGSARQFSGDHEAPSKNINTMLLKKKICVK